MPEIKEPWLTFLLATVLCGLAGLTRSLMARKTRRDVCGVVSTTAWSAMWGLGITLVVYERYNGNPYTILGGCILSVLAGNTSSKELLFWLKTGMQAVDLLATARYQRSKREGRKEDGKDDGH